MKLHKEGKAVPLSFKEDIVNLAKEIPKGWLNKSQFQKSQQLFEGVYDPEETDFDKFLMSPKIMEKLEQSNGWMFTSLTIADGGHQILFRLDQNRGKAWLFDPNIGFFCFEAPEKTFDQARSECLKCFRNICEVFYPALYNIKIRQLIPKNSH